jgi:hypothetical protein
MPDNVVWFGTKQFMQWIPAPLVDVAASKQGFSAEASFLTGGAWVRRSKGAAQTYTMSWNRKTRDELRPIMDYADGLYGNGYIYYLDPFAMDDNVLPTYWATPYQNYYDGPVIVDGKRPALITNATSTNGYPIESAQYTITSTSNSPSIYIPIPPGYTFHMGAHGSLISGNASVKVTPQVTGVTTGTAANLTLLTTASTTRTNYTLQANAGFVGVTVSMTSTSTGVLQLDGLIAQVLPDGQSPAAGGFISGQGSSGLQFRKQPTYSQYSIAFDMVGLAVDLVETEAYQWL